ncbi:hypothetical protein MTX78_04375 [Hymenobacter tibetensis]|uniref:Septum formation inhibitor Maf n=1 Tax=Hymenobacter tibetensis TaxID=497967 RepID=A0ABY4D1B1_9BACT|nr:hypothetical protein [Hymenobacter tibetensis]UOG75837.1 hypothetical protein MTX78_04375 [Hymenobacter tibetensis]
MPLLSRLATGFSLPLLLLACSTKPGQPTPTAPVATPVSAEFSRYWYAGQAELSRYQLQQNRYDDVHPGEAVLVFVTEDFLPVQQVKMEGGPTTETPVSVLKMNQMRRFTTGIYDYSINTSVFTPVPASQFPHTLKVATSVQDWCGQTYTQLNLRRQKYHLGAHSYFQQEADQTDSLDAVVLEDELWNRLRLDPRALPVGELRIIPGTVVSRLRHQPLRVETARATLTPYQGSIFKPAQAGAALQAYTLSYPTTNRTLTIVFESAFPYLIAGWEDTYDGQMKLGNQTFGSAKPLTTRAIRTATLKSDYWQRHTRPDSVLRRQLGATGFGK